MKIVVLGGTGFIGRHICERLVQQGHEVTVPTRKLEQAREIQMLPRLQPVRCDVHDAAQLAQAVQGHEVLINLVAILHGSEEAFERVHVALPRKIVAAAQTAGIQRIVHISSLGVSVDAPSAYLRSKARGEQVLADSGLDVRVLRPSVVFGEGDRLLNVFAQLQQLFPFMPLAGADSQYEPVWVQDVAQAAVLLASDQYYQNKSNKTNKYPDQTPKNASKSHIVEVAGDHTLTLRDLVALAGRSVGAQRPIFALPNALARLQATVMEKLPGPTLMSRDNLGSMQVPSVASGNLPGLRDLGIEPASIYAIAPAYLKPASKLDQFRQHASR
jgi:NADH dehydrogenase